MFGNSIYPEQSTADGRFITRDELELASKHFNKAKTAFNAAKKLTENAESLAIAAAQSVYRKYPYTTETKRSQYAYDQRGHDKCVRDISYYLRMITYCLVAGGTGPMDEYLLSGMSEINRTFDLSSSWYIEALKYIRENHGLETNEAAETNSYIDYAISALS
jgi:phycocyanin alpha chain